MSISKIGVNYFLASCDTSFFRWHSILGSGSGAQARGKDWMLPFREQARNAGGQAGNEARTYPSEGRTKKVVRINIE